MAEVKSDVKLRIYLIPRERKVGFEGIHSDVLRSDQNINSMKRMSRLIFDLKGNELYWKMVESKVKFRQKTYDLQFSGKNFYKKYF